MFTLFSFYRSKEWESLRNQLRLERVNECGDVICEHCHKPIVKAYDIIAHHKTHLTESNVNDYSISLNPDNIMLVHHKCHNEIHNRFGFNYKKVFIVYGSPCSGKSYYVNDVAGKDDLIICLDRIYESINNTRSQSLYQVVMSIYRQLIDTVKTRNGQWNNAYILRGFPNSAERERLAKQLDAELIFINTDKETCLERALTRGPNYDKIVLDWWNKYQA